MRVSSRVSDIEWSEGRDRVGDLKNSERARPKIPGRFSVQIDCLFLEGGGLDCRPRSSMGGRQRTYESESFELLEG